MNEKLLIKKIKLGDGRAFEELYSRYLGTTRGIVWPLLRNEEDVEEVLNTTWFQVYKGIRKFKGESAFASWLYRIATNAALMRLRKRRKEKAHLGIEDYKDLIPCKTPSVEKRLVERSKFSRIGRICSKLPDGYSNVLVITAFGYENKDGARILDISLPAFKSRLNRTRKEVLRYVA